MRKWLLWAMIIVLIDQMTKYWIGNLLYHEQMMPITPFFNLVLVYNQGAAFGLFAEASGWQFYLFTTLALGISVILLLLLHKHHQEIWLSRALSLILGGAIGNVIDRFLHGHVIDFIDIYYQHYHWPAFNVADSAICVGAALLMLESFLTQKMKR